MKYIHQWKDILSSVEVLNPQLESQMEEYNEPSIETSIEQHNDPSIEPSPIPKMVHKNEAHIGSNIELAVIEENYC